MTPFFKQLYVRRNGTWIKAEPHQIFLGTREGKMVSLQEQEDEANPPTEEEVRKILGEDYL